MRRAHGVDPRTSKNPSSCDLLKESLRLDRDFLAVTSLRAEDKAASDAHRALVLTC